eukprot:1139984-Pelagomonas_calceolata.AAC.1
MQRGAIKLLGVWKRVAGRGESKPADAWQTTRWTLISSFNYELKSYLDFFKEANKLAQKLHAHSVHHAHKLATAVDMLLKVIATLAARVEIYGDASNPPSSIYLLPHNLLVKGTHSSSARVSLSLH